MALRSLLPLVIYMLIGMFIGSLLSLGIWSIGALDIQHVMDGEAIGMNKRNLFRIGMIVNHLSIFLLPGLFYLTVKEKSRWPVLQNLQVPWIKVLLWALVIFFSYPFIAQLTVWNMSIPFPDWMNKSQDDSFALLTTALKMEHWSEIVLSFLLVGLAAAIGEELIFRKIIQNKLLSHWSNPHVSILVASLLFGMMHMQAQRILPLTLLGLLLGYSYYYTKQFVVPVLLHLLNNTLQLAGVYIADRLGHIPDIEEIPEVPIGAVAISTVIAVIIIRYLLSIRESNESRP